MGWKEVTTIQVEGKVLVAKDAMIMLSEDEQSPNWPFIHCESGEYIFEIQTTTQFHANGARIKRVDSEPIRGRTIGDVDIDHAFLGFIDYETFRRAVTDQYDDYGEWTAMELDDELAQNFSGQISFNDAKLAYVSAGNGDGTYPCFELLEDGVPVGIECDFGST